MFIRFIIISLFILTPLYADYAQTAKEVYQEFLSPFCPGRALADCPSGKAKELKLEILEELKSGKSKIEVMSELESQFGEELNANPGLSGLGLWVWLVPGTFVLLALFLIIKWIRSSFKTV